MKHVLLMGTLDTKGPEIRYVKERLVALQVPTLVMDTGILGEPVGIAPDITREEVALAAGSTIDQARNAGSRGAAVEIMCRGIARIAARLHAEGTLGGILCLGGAEGAVLGAAAMHVVPVGVPKILVTPLASGSRTFGPFTGAKDVMVMHSVMDILGINPLSRAIYDSAAGAMAGAYREAHEVTLAGERLVGITILGNTDRCASLMMPRLREAGWDPVIFHANGVGGQAMEEFIRAGHLQAVIDLTIGEVTGHLVGGYHDGGPHRLEAAGQAGIPQVVVPGCIDFIATGPMRTLDPRWHGRPLYYHNPEFTLVRITQAESAEIGRTVARKLNGAKGPTRVLWPRRGLSIANRQGGEFYDPEADEAFLQNLRATLRSDIDVIEVDAHINDERFAEAVFRAFVDIAGGS